MAVGDIWTLRLEVDGTSSQALRGELGGLGTAAANFFVWLTGGTVYALQGPVLGPLGWEVVSVLPQITTTGSFIVVQFREKGSVALVLLIPVLKWILAILGVVVAGWVILRGETVVNNIVETSAERERLKKIQDTFLTLIAQGKTAEEAAAIVRSLYPPPPLPGAGGSFDWILPIAVLAIIAFALPPFLESLKSREGGSRSRTYDPSPWVHGMAKRAIERRVLR